MKSMTRPVRLDQSELDMAVSVALQRVAQATELSAEECGHVGGAGPGQLSGKVAVENAE